MPENNSKYKVFIQLHIIVFILGFTAILGKLIQLNAAQLVFWRVLIASVSIFIFLKAKKTPLKIPFRDFLFICFTGLIVAAHWICFFQSIKVSNVSVALGVLSSGTLMTSFLEPLIHRKKISVLEIIIGLFIIVGIYIIFRFETKYIEGIIYALLAAFLSGLFTVINKLHTKKYDGNLISFYELSSAIAAVFIYIAFTDGVSQFAMPTFWDFVWLFILGTVCTAFAFVGTIELMKHISAYSVVLAINLEPVYGIFLAFFIFGQSELMTSGFYAGTLILLLSVFLYPILKRKFFNKS